MNFQLMVYFNFTLLLIGIFGILYSRDIISVLISLQLILTSGFVNFLGFSRFLYQHSIWDKVFIISGFTVVYLLMFCLIYYAYLNKGELDRKELYGEFKFFRITRDNWWGEDDI